MSPPSGGNGLSTTRPSVMGVIAVLGGCVGWIVAVLLSSTSRSVVGMSWAVTALWAVFACVMLGAAWRTYDVLHRKKQRMASAYAVRMLVMGKATAVVAPAVGGFYLGLGLWRATLGPGSFTESATLSLVVGGLVLFVAAVGGLLLEIACRRPAGPEDEDGTARA
jgi:Protein of unknown function (DUF3180)